MERLDQIMVIRAEIDRAAGVILTATTEAMLLVGACGGAPTKIAQMEEKLHTILEACAFHDLVSQRFDQLAAPSEDPLLNGPASPGEGLDQAAADRLFDDALRGG